MDYSYSISVFSYIHNIREIYIHTAKYLHAVAALTTIILLTEQRQTGMNFVLKARTHKLYPSLSLTNL